MAASAIILILCVLCAVILLHLFDDRISPFTKITNWTFILIGSLAGIIIAAITVGAVTYFYKRKRDTSLREQGGGGRTFSLASDYPKAAISKHSSGNYVTNTCALLQQSPMCNSCQCRNGQLKPEHQMISPSINHQDTRPYTQMDDRQHKQTEQYSTEPDLFIVTAEVNEQVNPTFVALDLHNHAEQLNIKPDNSAPVESYC